jgi:hypothetical protein
MGFISLNPHTFRRPPQQAPSWQEVTVVPTSRAAVTQSIVPNIGFLLIEANDIEASDGRLSAERDGDEPRSDCNQFLLLNSSIRWMEDVPEPL